MEAQPDTIGTDLDLVGAIIEPGDEQAFRELYRRHTPRLLGFISRLLAGADLEAEDAVQETWIRTCERLEAPQESFDNDSSRPLRYTGTLSGTEIEVRGGKNVRVEVDEETGEIVIRPGDSVVLLKSKDKQ